MDSQALQAATAATAASYRSFAEATRAVLDLLERHLPDAAVYLSHLDRGQDLHRIVDARSGAGFSLRSNDAIPLGDAFCSHMADNRAPRRCNDVPNHPLYSRIDEKLSLGVGAYLGVPIELSDGSRVGALSAFKRPLGHFVDEDEQLFGMLARVLGSELERETNARDLRRLNDTLRGQARGLAALNQVARALADGEDARGAVCRSAADAAVAPIAFLLEPNGTDFTSTAMTGVDLAPVTVQARTPDGSPSTAALIGTERYFISDVTVHAALAEPLIRATRARSALFEPVLRNGKIVAVLIVIWQDRVERLDGPTAATVDLIAAQAAVAVEQAALREKVQALAFTDRLTGLVTRRTFDEELPRELARSRRGDSPICVAVLDIDHMAAFNMIHGEREGDRLVKESGAAWTTALRAVDLVARLEGDEFGVLLPACDLGEAIDVVNRLRELTPRGQSCSAGLARWDGAEPAEILLLRVNDALAAAKAAGRDLTIAADDG